MNFTLKSLTIIIAAFLSLIITRIGISYLLILIALGLILPFITEDKKSAIISGILYATISYVLSYPSGLFLINYMPTIDIPINVSPIEVIFNLLIGLLIPIIIATIICYISAIIGTYISKLIKHYLKENNDNPDEKHHFNDYDEKHYFNDYDEKHYFNDNNNIENDFTNKYEKRYENDTYSTKKRLNDLSPIQKAKNRRNRRD